MLLLVAMRAAGRCESRSSCWAAGARAGVDYESGPTMRDCVVDEDSEHEGGGLRQLDVFCVDDDVVVADEECDADDKPAGTWECLATTVVVDPIEETIKMTAAEENPLKTLRACIKRFGEDHSATRKLPHDDDHAARLRAARRRLPGRGVDAAGRRRPFVSKAFE